MGFRGTGTTIGLQAGGFRPPGLGGPRKRPAGRLARRELQGQSLNTSSEQKRIETLARVGQLVGRDLHFEHFLGTEED